MMTIRINCGCGFKTAKIEEAEKHANTTQHTLHVQGEVKPTEVK